ncbi:ParB/RepB/Spo0J family partition protein [Virgisporangium aurantiacum]|uniref:ParB/RepB/Spo0J family partition protein n=1 Tax=Virgisporangium aurantiacum TaxID=175570 RepID=UPI00194F8E4A|nr:ParB/RepB/Spo0J family partition protein [Virgisporangium aurantiacum]
MSHLLHNAPTAVVPVSAVRPGTSPRLGGERPDHVRTLAEAESELPPILVHRATMQVIDGVHRLLAARLRGAQTIRVRFFDGAESMTFPLAVEANVMHGLPLSLAEREAAAERILRTEPDWSDRAVAAVTGLAPNTVAAIRRRWAPTTSGAARIGRDGRRRPLDATEGRRLAGDFIARHPDASLREIARAAGISTGTARDVRARITRGDDAVRPHRSAPHDGADAAVRVDRLRDPAALLHILRRDPSLRLTEHGRGLLRWLDARASGPAGGEAHLERLPAHCALLMAELARSCAQRWLEFADRLDDLAGAPDDLPAVQVRTMSG